MHIFVPDKKTIIRCYLAEETSLTDNYMYFTQNFDYRL